MKNEWHIVLDPGENFVHGSCVVTDGVDPILLLTTNTKPARLIKINPINGGAARITFPIDGLHDYSFDCIAASDKTKAYVGFISSGIISEVTLATLKTLDRLVGDVYGGETLAADAGYLYKGSGGIVKRYNLSNWIADPATPIGVSITNAAVHCLRINTANGKMFATSKNDPGGISRIDVKIFTEEQGVTFKSGWGTVTDDMAITRDNVWLGLENIPAVLGVNQTNLNIAIQINIPVSAGSKCLAVAADDRYVYAAMSSGHLAVIDPVTNVAVALPLNADQPVPNEIQIIGDRILLTGYTNPSWVSCVLRYTIDEMLAGGSSPKQWTVGQDGITVYKDNVISGMMLTPTLAAEITEGMN